MIIKYCNKNPQNDVIQLQRATKPKKNEVQNDYKNHMIAPIMRYWDIWCYKTQIFFDSHRRICNVYLTVITLMCIL